MKKFTDRLSLTVLLLTGIFVQPVHADSPALTELKIRIAALQKVLGDPTLTDHKYFLQRRKPARVVLQQIFDFEEMSRRSLGPNLRRYNDRMGEFTPLFVDFFEHGYMGKLEENGDAKIQYIREIVDDERVEIDLRDKTNKLS